MTCMGNWLIVWALRQYNKWIGDFIWQNTIWYSVSSPKLHGCVVSNLLLWWLYDNKVTQWPKQR